METRSGLSSSVRDLTVEFGYDSQGRRFKKTVTSNAVSSTTYFLYDGWNLVAEFAHQSTPPHTHTTSYVWGSDLSGSGMTPEIPIPTGHKSNGHSRGVSGNR